MRGVRLEKIHGLRLSFEGNAVDSLPVVAQAFGDERATAAFTRPPAGSLLPD